VGQSPARKNQSCATPARGKRGEGEIPGSLSPAHHKRKSQLAVSWWYERETNWGNRAKGSFPFTREKEKKKRRFQAHAYELSLSNKKERSSEGVVSCEIECELKRAVSVFTETERKEGGETPSHLYGHWEGV